MKKFVLLFASVLITFAVIGVNEVKAQVPEFSVALGASYPDAPGKAGFDSAVKFNFKLNRMLGIGVESGFGWINSEKKAGEAFIGDVELLHTESVNFYSVPVLGGFTFNFPLGDQYSPLSFFVSGAAGYSWTFYRGDESYIFQGFTWQALAGFGYTYDEDFGNMKLFCEIGYRGTMIKSNIEVAPGITRKLELDMSAPFVRIGVSFPLGYSDFM